MKKLLGIVVLGLLFSGNAYSANTNKIPNTGRIPSLYFLNYVDTANKFNK